MSSMKLSLHIASILVAGALYAEPSRAQGTASPPQTVAPLDADSTPFTSQNLLGHHLWIVVFDKSTMRVEDVQRSADDALAWSRQTIANVDLIAVATIGVSGAQMLQDFTTNHAKIERALAGFGRTAPDADAGRSGGGATSDLEQQADDVRLGGLKLICTSMKAWKVPKDLLYFTAGMDRGAENSLSYRDAVTACEGANVTISTFDPRGLTGRSAGRGALIGSFPTPDFNTLTPRAERADAQGSTSASNLAGTWTCDRCPSTPPGLGTTFTIRDASTGSSPVLVPNGQSQSIALTRRGDALVRVIPTTVSQKGQNVSVTLTYTFALSADGRLQVTITGEPSGIFADLVSVYRRK